MYQKSPKHKYEIIINNGSNRLTAEYDFGPIKGISLAIEEQNATIIIEVGTLRTPENILQFKYKDFRDAYRKVVLLHAVNFNTGLIVNKITVSVDGEVSIFDKENDPIGFFPYMITMIDKIDLGLSESWAELSSAIVDSTQTKVGNDLRFSSAYSFLASKGRAFSVDKFSNLWTSMNAYLSYVSKNYEEKMMNDYDLESLSSKLKISARDAESIGLTSWLVFPQYTDISCGRDALRELWKNNYDVEKNVKTYSSSDISKLYEAAQKELEGEALPEEYLELSKNAEKFNVKLYNFLLFVYPYNLRCKYFHGNTPTILLAAYNDCEVKALETVNYFLTQFLNENIPKTFQNDFWTDEKQKAAIEYVEYIQGGKKIEKLVESCKKKIEEEKRHSKI